MMISKICSNALILCSISLSCIAYAGDERGNGGDAVVCRNQSGAIISAETLDHYYARIYLGSQIDVGSQGDSTYESALEVFNRIPNSDSARKKQYLEWASAFESEALFIPGVTLVDIPDSLHIDIPVGCLIEQVAIHREPSLPRERRYTINKDIWDAMNHENQVTLIIHEVIYRDALKELHQNSVNTRKFVSLLLERKFSEMPIGDYAAMLKSLNFNFTGEKCEDVNYPQSCALGANNQNCSYQKTTMCYVADSKKIVGVKPNGTKIFQVSLTKDYALPSEVEIRYTYPNRVTYMTYTYKVLSKYAAGAAMAFINIGGYVHPDFKITDQPRNPQ